MPHLVAAPDKFRGSVEARVAADAMAAAAESLGWTADRAPMSDGGEGFCEVFPGKTLTVLVRGPLGEPVRAAWKMLPDNTTAVIESALASGLSIIGGPGSNDAVEANSTGTGQLIAEAVKAGATRVLVGMGGTATTDGGLGALEALEPHSRLRGVELVVACDVSTLFLDAALSFAAQKGASENQVRLLSRRLERLVGLYKERFGIEVTDIPGAGAAGGLAGGLAAVGARLVPGFDLVAEAVELEDRVYGADLVVTGEGFLDEQSFQGKVVGGVARMAETTGADLLVIAGDGDGDQPVAYVSLVERYGLTEATERADRCLREVVETHIAAK